MSRIRPPGQDLPQVVEAKVAAWNRVVPVGTPVLLIKDLGETIETKTRSPAWAMGGHTAVVTVEGIAGGYLLSRVIPSVVAVTTKDVEKEKRPNGAQAPSEIAEPSSGQPGANESASPAKLAPEPPACLRTLSPEELATFKPMASAEIEAALSEGARDRNAYEAATRGQGFLR